MLNMVYIFEDYDYHNSVLEKILDKCEHRDECLIWTGGLMDKKYPVIWTAKPKKCYIVRIFMHELINNDGVDTHHVVDATCNNPMCISPEHLVKVLKKSEWDPKKTMEKLVRMSERMDPMPNQEIGCLIWKGQLDTHKKYGIISINCRKMSAHVASLLIKENITEMPKDDQGRIMLACHICPNKLCCEPSHIELGTYDKNNLDDRIRDGTIKRNDPKRAYLTEQQAIEVKLSRLHLEDPNYITIDERAEKYGIPRHIITSIDYGHSWAHLPGPRDKQNDILKAKKVAKKRETKQEYFKNGINHNDYESFQKKIYGKTMLVENKSLNTPCRIYQGTIHGGYGRTRYKGIEIFTHVAICEISTGRKKHDHEVTRHLCDNKTCCAADHLVFGTKSENALDAIRSGILKTKINMKQAREIRKLFNNGMSKKDIAAKYELVAASITVIINNQQWREENSS